MPAFKKVDQEMASSLTLRDYFAARAMPAVIGNRISDKLDMSGIALAAYMLADAMLKERVK